MNESPPKTRSDSIETAKRAQEIHAKPLTGLIRKRPSYKNLE